MLGSRRAVIGRAADLEKNLATEKEIEAMEDGAVAIPKVAGESITGGRPAPGNHRGQPAGQIQQTSTFNLIS